MSRKASWVAAIGLALAAFAAAPAMAQSYSPVVTTAPGLGIIVPAASSSTTFSFASSSGVVSQSGSAVRRTVGTTRGEITISCTGSGNVCGDAIKVAIGSIGTPTGKAGALSNFNVTAIANGGAISGASGTNPISFTITPKNKSTAADFYFGADFPINSSASAGSAGTANSGFYVYVAHSPTTPTTGTSGNATATTYRGIAFSGTPTLNFGSIVKPSSGNVTVTLDPSTNAISAVGTGTGTAGVAGRAVYTLTGEGGMAITVTPATSFVMSKVGGGSTPITVTLSNTTLPTLLSGSTGSQGSATFYMGGSFTIDTSTQSGAYSGSYDVTAVYN